MAHIISADAAAVYDAAADAVVETLSLAATGKKAVHFVLTGGQSPGPLYERLAAPPRAARVDWGRVHFWWGDERFVPAGDAANNGRRVRETFLDRLPVTPASVHPMETNFTSPEKAAESYEAELRRAFAGPPAFDLLLLSVGPDGHVASLFPGAPAMKEWRRWVVAVRGAPKPPPDRLTITPAVLQAAVRIYLLAIGADRAAIYKKIRAGGRGLPAALAAKNPGARWFVQGVAPSEGEVLK